ncbi:hypothetical protein ACTFIR_011852 [Dictyostelium discoideum]
MVGMVETTSPNFNLYKNIDLLTPSSPIINILVSFLPSNNENILLKNDAKLRNNKTKERINKKQTDLFEKEERVRKSSELGEKLRFMTDDTRKQFHSLSSNQTYHNEKSYNNIKQLELDALKNQDETSKMLMCMRVFCSSFSNSPQMTPSLQPTIQFNNNFTPSPNSAYLDPIPNIPTLSSESYSNGIVTLIGTNLGTNKESFIQLYGDGINDNINIDQFNVS